MKSSVSYLQAKRKVEILKSFYQHLVVFILINAGVILWSANFFNGKEIDFSRWEIYFPTIMWGIGLFFHALYALFELYLKNNFLKQWEENKIREFMENDDF